MSRNKVVVKTVTRCQVKLNDYITDTRIHILVTHSNITLSIYNIHESESNDKEYIIWLWLIDVINGKPLMTKGHLGVEDFHISPIVFTAWRDMSRAGWKCVTSLWHIGLHKWFHNLWAFCVHFNLFKIYKGWVPFRDQGFQINKLLCCVDDIWPTISRFFFNER